MSDDTTSAKFSAAFFGDFFGDFFRPKFRRLFGASFFGVFFGVFFRPDFRRLFRRLFWSVFLSGKISSFFGREKFRRFFARIGESGLFGRPRLGESSNPPLKGTPAGGLERARPPRLGLFLSSKSFLPCDNGDETAKSRDAFAIKTPKIQGSKPKR